MKLPATVEKRQMVLFSKTVSSYISYGDFIGICNAFALEKTASLDNLSISIDTGYGDGDTAIELVIERYETDIEYNYRIKTFIDFEKKRQKQLADRRKQKKKNEYEEYLRLKEKFEKE